MKKLGHEVDDGQETLTPPIVKADMWGKGSQELADMVISTAGEVLKQAAGTKDNGSKRTNGRFGL